MKTGGILLCVLLVQLCVLFAYGLVTQEKVCGVDRIAYFGLKNYQLYYINLDIVHKEIFCERLALTGCLVESEFQGASCGFIRPSDGSSFKPTRELLQTDSVKDISIPNDASKEFKGRMGSDYHELSNFPKVLTIAAPGLFFLCCCFLFPCFRSRNKDTEADVLVRHSSAMDPISSMEMSSERAPASPLRVGQSPRFSMSPNLSRHGSVKLDYDQIAKATHQFSSSHKIGEGGFGSVYKAQLQNGQTVAVKRAKREHFNSMRNEFSNEVELLSKIDHRRLVRLIGYVDHGDERLIMMEYVPNATLRDHLDGRRGQVLDFNHRLEIAIDVAHALTYLHSYAEKQIIHRDIKSSNILLTENFRAKVADFGIAKLSAADTEATHVSTKVKGTVGYMDPEYMRTYQLSTKSDVYSFGVLLVEILTGRRPVDIKKPQAERVTLRWAFKKYISGNEGILEMVDPMMQEEVDVKILEKFFGLAIQCAAPIIGDRPDMKIVREELWAIKAILRDQGSHSAVAVPAKPSVMGSPSDNKTKPPDSVSPSGVIPPLNPILESRSFAATVATSRPKLKPRFSPISLPSRQVSSKDGKPAISFSSSEIGACEKRFEFSIIAKFTIGRPSLSEIQKAFKSNWEIKGRASLSEIWDSRHVLIILDSEADVRTTLTSPLNKVEHAYFRLFRWRPDYNPKKKSTITTVWIRLPGLPLSIYDSAFVEAIVSTFGYFVGVDDRTKACVSVKFARACVELDVTQPIPESVWINMPENSGFWQPIVVETKISYCSKCKVHGHYLATCRKTKYPAPADAHQETRNVVMEGRGDISVTIPGASREANKEEEWAC